MKATFNKIKGYLFLVSLILFTLASCNKDDDPATGTANLNVFLKSSVSQAKSAAVYEEVNLDIQHVYFHASTDSAETSGWQELETYQGIIDLLKDSIEKDTLLAFDSVLQTQTISQIRLVLGGNNSVVADGESYDLDTPSGQTSGIKVQVHAELEAEKSYKILLDFDVYKSVLETGNGKFKLKPVINATVVEQ